MPFLTYPLALLALAGIPALAVIYFLRNRFRRSPVSSLMLWRFKSRFLEGGSRITRIVTPLTFFLELLIILLIITAAVDPRWQTNKNRIPVFVILDDSFSMLAETGAGTPKEQAEKEVLRVKGYVLHFILAGKEPQLVRAPDLVSEDVSSLLRRWTCSSTSDSIEESVRLAREITGDRTAILVLTDHGPPPGFINGERIKWLAFGQKVPNSGITGAARTFVNGKDRCFLEVCGFSNEETKSVLTLADGKDRELLNKPMTLKNGAAERLILDVPRGTGAVHAWLSHDAMEPDNHVYLAPPVEPHVRVRTDISDEKLKRLFDDGLKATGMSLPELNSPELVITDSPGTEPNNPAWVVRLHTGKDARAYTGPYIVDMAHPLAKGIELSGVIWGADEPDGMAGIPVITAGNFPLITDEVLHSGRHEIHIRLNPDFSNLQDTPNWPIIMWNLLNWRLKESSGWTAEEMRLGDEIREESDLSDCLSGEWGKLVDAETVKEEYPGTSWIWILFAMAALAAHLGILTQRRRN